MSRMVYRGLQLHELSDGGLGDALDTVDYARSIAPQDLHAAYDEDLAEIHAELARRRGALH